MSEYIIQTNNLTKQYGEQKSVSAMNLHVKKGRIYGLLGRNGAGKTTTMKMLLGLTKPTSGNIKIFGKSMETNSKDILPHIGSLIESPGFYPNLTGTENLRIFAELRGLNKSKCVTNDINLQGKRDYGEDYYTGTYQAEYKKFSDTEYLFGGTTIERAAGKQVELFCNLEITKGEAEIFIISGSNEPKTLIKTTGTYENTITLPDGSNYIGIVGNDFSGTVKIEVK